MREEKALKRMFLMNLLIREKKLLLSGILRECLLKFSRLNAVRDEMKILRGRGSALKRGFLQIFQRELLVLFLKIEKCFDSILSCLDQD